MAKKNSSPLSARDLKRIRNDLTYALYVDWDSTDVRVARFGESLTGRFGSWRHEASLGYCHGNHSLRCWEFLPPEEEERRACFVQDFETIHLSPEWFDLFSDLPERERERLAKMNEFPELPRPASSALSPFFRDYLKLIDFDEDRRRVRKTLLHALYGGVGSWWSERFTFLGREIVSHGVVTRRGVMDGGDYLIPRLTDEI